MRRPCCTAKQLNCLRLEAGWLDCPHADQIRRQLCKVVWTGPVSSAVDMWSLLQCLNQGCLQNICSQIACHACALIQLPHAEQASSLITDVTIILLCREHNKAHLRSGHGQFEHRHVAFFSCMFSQSSSAGAATAFVDCSLNRGPVAGNLPLGFNPISRTLFVGSI